MPYRGRKTYKKPKRYGKKKYTKRRPVTSKSKYPNTRATAIQRMDLVPRTRLMKCVFDQTYLITPNGDKLTNTFGLCFNLTNLFDGPANTIPTAADGTVPFWGAYLNTETLNQSGDAHNAKPYGFSRFIGDGSTTTSAPYKNYMVLGGKWTLRVEQTHKTGASAPSTQDLAKLVAVVSRYGRDNDSALGPNQSLSEWQNHRGIKQSNMTALAASGTNRPSSGSNQQVRQSGTFSAKKWFDVKDVKDNLNRLGGSFNDSGTYIPPEEACFLQIGFFDRLRRGDDTGYVMPNVMCRFRYEAVVLCTETNQLNNIQA